LQLVIGDFRLSISWSAISILGVRSILNLEF